MLSVWWRIQVKRWISQWDSALKRLVSTMSTKTVNPNPKRKRLVLPGALNSQSHRKNGCSWIISGLETTVKKGMIDAMPSTSSTATARTAVKTT